jgi:hypothetical protein
MITMLESFWERFQSSLKLNIKLASFVVIKREEKKRRYITCTRVNRDLLTSVLTSTSSIHRSHYVAEIV